MPDPWILGVLALVVGAGVWIFYRRRERAATVGRLAEPFLEDEEYQSPLQPIGLAPRHAWLPYAAVALLGLALWLFGGWAGVFCVALVLVGWVISSILLSTIAKRRSVRLETQLAIDRLPTPRDLQSGEVGRVDLVECGVLRASEVAAVMGPLPIRRAVLPRHFRGCEDEGHGGQNADEGGREASEGG